MTGRLARAVAGLLVLWIALPASPALGQAPGSGNQPATEPSDPAVQAAPGEQGPAYETWQARFQSTYVRQHPNAELARTSGRDPTFYVARGFIRQTLGFGGGTDRVVSDQNQLAGTVERRRLVLTAGILPVIDLFDDNAFSHDART